MFTKYAAAAAALAGRLCRLNAVRYKSSVFNVSRGRGYVIENRTYLGGEDGGDAPVQGYLQKLVSFGQAACSTRGRKRTIGGVLYHA